MKGIIRALQASFIVNLYNIMYCFKLNIWPPRFNFSSMFQTEHEISICYDEQCVKCIHNQKSKCNGKVLFVLDVHYYSLTMQRVTFLLCVLTSVHIIKE